jgi:hypothetical protein
VVKPKTSTFRASNNDVLLVLLNKKKLDTFNFCLTSQNRSSAHILYMGTGWKVTIPASKSKQSQIKRFYLHNYIFNANDVFSPLSHLVMFLATINYLLNK